MGRVLQLIGLAVVATVWMVPIEARAAVGVCKPSHAGEVAEDKSELQAKKRALESWVARASQYGKPYALWGIAANRRLECTRTDSGLFRCTAVGHPCTIRQVPPANFIPLKRTS
jgi:hypothetical protein